MTMLVAIPITVFRALPNWLGWLSLAQTIHLKPIGPDCSILPPHLWSASKGGPPPLFNVSDEQLKREGAEHLTRKFFFHCCSFNHLPTGGSSKFSSHTHTHPWGGGQHLTDHLTHAAPASSKVAGVAGQVHCGGLRGGANESPGGGAGAVCWFASCSAAVVFSTCNGQAARFGGQSKLWSPGFGPSTGFDVEKAARHVVCSPLNWAFPWRVNMGRTNKFSSFTMLGKHWTVEFGF